MSKSFYLLLLLISLLFTACSPTPPIAPPTKQTPKSKPKIAIAFGGGAAKGFAHIGVIKVLEQNGIRPDIITGTSAGAVIGSLYASGLSPIEIQQKAMSLKENQLTDFTLSTAGIIKGEVLQAFINHEVQQRPIEKLPIHFGAVSTNKESGEAIVFRSGNTGQAVRASASIPNVFLPVKIGNSNYVDGGLVQPVPVEAAKNMGADIIIAIDISTKPTNGNKGFWATLDQSFSIMNQAALDKQLKMATIVIQPEINTLSSVLFEQRHQAILEGEKAALASLPKIKKVISEAYLQ
ncbi:MAG: patatin-like phospholipase family protein [Sulfuricurvum sp.]|uniref:patatin-like phospholipase family protein n=1 Tax=Sulfuricurvum sp. TaxID=2025608 RepID=UPI002602CE4C|nr:patatin-like phospholipase family protein [Sulfuricurvum sp.]MDD2829467.1 patatin-like phospholipase family protein [Sulfuricurvum sp.]MDD4948450.1 patatin-like phospholipase family protein [Sulfuricurvum sp.]